MDSNEQVRSRVRLKSSPAKAGWTTGRARRQGPIELVEVEFPGGPPEFKPASALEPAPEQADLFADLAAGRISGPADLGAAITIEKLRGNLTELVYSMGAGKTDFYPHQFKPVLQFAKSSLGRILIADEVGLGKTIEAIYIWKEIQVRDQARRLLVVCPSMLRRKWRRELEHAFGIEAREADAREVLEALERARVNPATSFALVASLEGLRPPKDYDTAPGPRAELARLLDANPAAEEQALIDLVVIDEAHYLRNRDTANNKLGALLRDAARRLVLLTATPIQIHTDNLFQLLHLADPEEFQNSIVFGIRERANEPIVRALRLLRRTPPDLRAATEAIDQALASPFFGEDIGLQELRDELAGLDRLPADRQIAAADLIESRSLFARHMTRSRKREVLERRVERSPVALSVEFTDYEKDVYRRMSEAIRARAAANWAGTSNGQGFMLVTRQRQMASSLAAALEGWADSELLEELVWEDRGLLAGDLDPNFASDLESYSAPDIDVRRLEAEDTKYAKLLEGLRAEVAADPAAKIVIFAYFKPTLRYLLRRLEADGISAMLLTGGMGEEKNRRLDQFAESDGPQVLLSSEVASEGVDLQFARVLVNYDLPWNPMRVEQRIGRLDRLGQKAEKITILNLFVENTVEEVILRRLYDRIEIFRSSVGDLEEILGEVAEQLMTEVMDPNLTDEQRLAAAEQRLLAIEKRIADTRQLEDEAQHLLGLGEFVLNRISDKRENGDWIRPEEVRGFIMDALRRRFPRSRVEAIPPDNGLFKLVLCEEARKSLQRFLESSEPDARAWGLTDSQKTYTCEPGQIRSASHGGNLVDAGHPVVRWLRHQLELEGAAPHAVVASGVAASDVPLASGAYSFVVESRSLSGVMKEAVLDTCAVSLDGAHVLFGVEATAVRLAAERGRRVELDDAAIYLAAEAARVAHQLVSERAGDRYLAFLAENERLCDQREATARSFVDRKVSELQARIEAVRGDSTRARIIPALQGQIRDREQELTTKLDRIERARGVDYATRTVAVGVLVVN